LLSCSRWPQNLEFKQSSCLSFPSSWNDGSMPLSLAY
jgi:hypothetical protein